MTILEAEAIRMPFGVHTDKTLAQIAAVEVDYFDYLLSIEGLDTYLAEAVQVVAAKHGRRAKARGRASFDGKQLGLF